ncbi:MAG: hypothetical protein QOF90_3701, partial [Acetobacteraceae bacterium]|nr:hypothetical protein [Acetobacteraceae bacterium]
MADRVMPVVAPALPPLIARTAIDIAAWPS